MFDQARTCAPLTLPSHTTIMTGLLPCQHGVRDNGLFRVGAQAPTLVRTLSAGGYATGAFVGAFVLDSSFGLAAGFDTYRDVKSKSVIGNGFYDERPATAVTADALSWLEQRPQDRPFFAWIHYFDAHAPYQSPISRPGLSPYDAEIAFVSEQMQVVLDRLGPALDDTLVVVTADHGEGLGEHGEDTHGYFIYESTMHVPLIFGAREPRAGRARRPERRPPGHRAHGVRPARRPARPGLRRPLARAGAPRRGHSPTPRSTSRTTPPITATDGVRSWRGHVAATS
jgi:arylsulfatase A-like enzyme